MVLGKMEFNVENIPMNIQAEQAVIAAILVNNNSWEKVENFLKPEHFSHPAHKFIFEVISKQCLKGMSADPITIKNYISQAGILDDVGGIGYLTELANVGTSVINVEQYAKLIYDTAVRRQLIEIGKEVIESASTEHIDLSVNQQIENVEQKLFELAQTGEVDRGPISFGKALTSALQTIETAYKSDGQLTGLTTGFIDLDKLIGGLHRSNLVILAGRPAMGKTTLALNIAFNSANEILMNRVPEKAKGAVLFFSLEMSYDELSSRILSNVCDINCSDILKGRISEEDFFTLTESSNALSNLPLIIDDSAAMTVPRIRSKARRIARQHGLALIIIDHIQLLESPSGSKQDNRVQELSEMTRGLKVLAKELNVPVLALSQLSRSVEQRPLNERRPVLSDLRESGSIEQDADIVMFTYRHEYYLQQQQKSLDKLKKGETPESVSNELERWKNKAELIISKNRHGPVKNIDLNFFGEYTRFSDPLPGEYMADKVIVGPDNQNKNNIPDDLM